MFELVSTSRLNLLLAAFLLAGAFPLESLADDQSEAAPEWISSGQEKLRTIQKIGPVSQYKCGLYLQDLETLLGSRADDVDYRGLLKRAVNDLRTNQRAHHFNLEVELDELEKCKSFILLSRIRATLDHQDNLDEEVCLKCADEIREIFIGNEQSLTVPDVLYKGVEAFMAISNEYGVEKLESCYKLLSRDHHPYIRRTVVKSEKPSKLIETTENTVANPDALLEVAKSENEWHSDDSIFDSDEDKEKTNEPEEGKGDKENTKRNDASELAKLIDTAHQLNRHLNAKEGKAKRCSRLFLAFSYPEEVNDEVVKVISKLRLASLNLARDPANKKGNKKGNNEHPAHTVEFTSPDGNHHEYSHVDTNGRHAVHVEVHHVDSNEQDGHKIHPTGFKPISKINKELRKIARSLAASGDKLAEELGKELTECLATRHHKTSHHRSNRDNLSAPVDQPLSAASSSWAQAFSSYTSTSGSHSESRGVNPNKVHVYSNAQSGPGLAYASVSTNHGPAPFLGSFDKKTAAKTKPKQARPVNQHNFDQHPNFQFFKPLPQIPPIPPMPAMPAMPTIPQFVNY